MVSPHVRQGTGKCIGLLSVAPPAPLSWDLMRSNSSEAIRSQACPADNNSLASFSPMAVGQWRVL